MRFWGRVAALCLVTTAAAAQEHPGTITTHATARARLANTVADVGLGIEAHGRTVAAVQQALSAGSATLLAQLRGAGAERLRTDQVGVTPDTSRTDNTAERILGYTGQLRVSFRVPAEKLGDVLGMALANGANTVDSTVLAPRETEVEAARQGLAASAVRTALAEARAVAEAAGYRVAGVQEILVDPGAGMPLQRPRPMFAAARAGTPAPVATEPGDSEVAATVSVVTTIQPGGEPPRP